ncbi:hypothetical protein [Arthrobacter sp. GMC3]|uniref:hypothetical protein n=1 Tax=Arthrobacter sp. GMC3 TaxID=2058894 RepID=UPI0011B0E170|nr:hypothetical protein [Arthrobacter sp. GMC3]
MRSKIAIVLAILGLVVLGLGIGQRTIWLPPATVTASVGGSVASAPLSVISPDVLATNDGKFTLTIKSAGPIQLAVGQVRDINGWVGDAAHTTVTGANSDFSALNTESKAGKETVPNPAGSDMWVTEEKATGELNYTWESPGHGDWALLVSSDGTAPAPTDISLTTANDAGTPWAVPLMIIGSVLLALAALMLWLGPRKPAAAQVAVAGRRTAGRVPSDPATGAMEVAKILAAKENAAKENSGSAAPDSDHSTIAELHRAERDAISGHSDSANTSNDKDDEQQDHGAAASLPTDVLGVVTPGTASIALDGTKDSLDGDKNEDAPADNSSADSAKSPDNDKDPDNDPSGGQGGKPAESSDASTAKESPAVEKGRKPRKPRKPRTSGGNEFSILPSTDGQDGRKSGKMMGASVKARWGAALAAVLLAGSVAPAVAEDATSTAPVSTPSATSTATATPSAPAVTQKAGFPTLLESQVQRIATSVATVVGTGDNAKNAKELESRVSGLALAARTANYKIRSTVDSEAAPQPVNSTRLLARVVSTSDTWPRTSMLVTQGENNPLPQLLTMVQNSPREQYKLVMASPLLPGQTFPAVDKEGSASVPLDAASGLLMSPKDAVAALSDSLVTADSKWKASFKDSVYITDVGTYQSTTLENSKDATVVFSHKADDKETFAMRTADGGALVVVGYTFSVDSTPKKDAKVNVPNASAAALAGGQESSTGVVVSYAEPVVMYIPPTADGKITIVSATRDLVSATFK